MMNISYDLSSAKIMGYLMLLKMELVKLNFDLVNGNSYLLQLAKQRYHRYYCNLVLGVPKIIV